MSRSLKVNFSLISSNKPKILTKTYHLQNDDLVKGTSANLVEGSVSLSEVGSLQGFADLLQMLAPNQALCFGVTAANGNLFSRKRFDELGRPAGGITRTKDKFHWPDGAGFMLLDYDPQPNQQALSRDELLNQLEQAAPDIATAGKVCWNSSSSHIFNGEVDLTGLRGQRVYQLVKDARDIPRAGDVLVKRLWLAGFGFYEVGAAGQKLERCTVDAQVWQTNRLDFAAGAKCQPPLQQKRGAPLVLDGEPLDTKQALPDLTQEEEAELATLKAQARAEVEPEAQAVQQLYIQEKALELLPVDLPEDEQEQALEQAERTVKRALEQGILTGDFPVILEGGEQVTIGQLLDDPAEYHGKLTLDPIEPEYQGGKVVGKLYLIGSRPNLYSFAHGGRSFKLLRQPREIELIQGRRHDAVQQVLSTMRVLPDVFDLGAQLVTVEQGRATPMDEQRFLFWLGGNFQFFFWKEKSQVLIKELQDPPAALAKQILALGSGRGLKPLDAVITAPVLRPDGSILSKPGYDEKTGLLLDSNDTMPAIPEDPTPEQVKAALDRLMLPFQTFPFVEAQDKGVMLAALLSAIMRPVVPTSPGFGFDAPVQGSGKTLLAECIGILATGEAPTVWPHTQGRDDEEIRKRLLTALRSGSRALIWDNVTGIFDSAALAAFLTSPRFTDRVLGQSMEITLPNRSLLVLTGNNLTLAGDMPRRVLKCRIDPKTERPFARRFDLDPKGYVKENRSALVAAGLTIVKGWLQSPECMFSGGIGQGRMASFEIWDDLVRQPVAWIAAKIAPGEYTDPMDVVDASQASDPEQEALYEMLTEVHGVFSDRPFSTKDLHRKAYGADFTPGSESLKESLEDLAGKPGITTKGLGRVLTFRADRMVQGLALVRAGKSGHTKQQLWKIRQQA